MAKLLDIYELVKDQSYNFIFTESFMQFIKNTDIIISYNHSIKSIITVASIIEELELDLQSYPKLYNVFIKHARVNNSKASPWYFNEMVNTFNLKKQTDKIKQFLLPSEREQFPNLGEVFTYSTNIPPWGSGCFINIKYLYDNQLRTYELRIDGWFDWPNIKNYKLNYIAEMYITMSVDIDEFIDYTLENNIQIGKIKITISKADLKEVLVIEKILNSLANNIEGYYFKKLYRAEANLLLLNSFRISEQLYISVRDIIKNQENKSNNYNFSSLDSMYLLDFIKKAE